MKYKIGEISDMIIHYVGNKYREEGVDFSRNSTDFQSVENELIATLEKSFVTENVHNFYYEPDLELNPVYRIAKAIFSDKTKFVEQSKFIARALYEQSYSPQIKGGELNIIYISKCEYDSCEVDAIAVLKTEIKQPIIQYSSEESGIKISKVDGVLLSRIDKGCLIFNTNEDSGYKVIVIDNKNNREAALYWKDSFLHIKPEQTAYHQTKELLNNIKMFVDNNVQGDKVEKAQVLSRTKAILSNAESINIEEFASEAFQNDYLADSFVAELRGCEEFDINHLEIPIEKRIAKPKSALPSTTIHLDKNFDIKIFGGDDMIIKGYDEDAQLYYYKLYYLKER